MEVTATDDIDRISDGGRIALETKWLTLFKLFDIRTKDGILTRGELEGFAWKLMEQYDLKGMYMRDLYNGIVGWWHVIKRHYGNDVESVTSQEFVHAVASIYQNERAALVGYTKEFARVLFDTMDTNCDGAIDLKDYLNFFDAFEYENEEFLSQSFQELDLKQKGFLRRRQFQKAVVVFNLSFDPEHSNDFLFALPEIHESRAI